MEIAIKKSTIPRIACSKSIACGVITASSTAASRRQTTIRRTCGVLLILGPSYHRLKLPFFREAWHDIDTQKLAPCTRRWRPARFRHSRFSGPAIIACSISRPKHRVRQADIIQNRSSSEASSLPGGHFLSPQRCREFTSICQKVRNDTRAKPCAAEDHDVEFLLFGSDVKRLQE